MSRPEHKAPPEVFYDDSEAKMYTTSSRMITVQSYMAERSLELLALPPDKPCLLLDVGCGSGLSGDVLSDAGHTWIGLDISSAMLDVALKRDVEGDLLHHDMGQGLPFRPGVFDGAVSVSALQWLCNQDSRESNPRRRLRTFFQSMYSVLTRGARAVFQFYPESPEQMDLIVGAATREGFGGGLVVDYPNSKKARKYFLCVWAGASSSQRLPAALTTDDGSEAAVVPYTKERSRVRPRRKGKRPAVKSHEWVLRKKERQRKQGKDVRPDTKYTARRRPGHGF